MHATEQEIGTVCPYCGVAVQVDSDEQFRCKGCRMFISRDQLVLHEQHGDLDTERRIFCPQCGFRRDPANLFRDCPGCGSWGAEDTPSQDYLTQAEVPLLRREATEQRGLSRKLAIAYLVVVALIFLLVWLAD